MADYLDFFNIYIMGSVQMLIGFYFFIRFLKKKIKWMDNFLFLFAVFGVIRIMRIPTGSLAEFFVYILLLAAGGIFLYQADYKLVILYAALTVEIMQLCYGIFNSVLSILYLWMPFYQKIIGIIFMVIGNMALCLIIFCYHMVERYFLYDETGKHQNLFLILTPILLLFCIGEYIRSVIYGNRIIIDEIKNINHYSILIIQVLGIASLFCILFAYKKLLENFRLSTELFLFEQEENFLGQYVEEARARYKKTRSFRHDIKNHLMILKELLQNEKFDQAQDYIKDMAYLAEELSFPCNTNHPTVDILIGNKLGIAKSNGIEVCCSLILPYPCLVRDIDFCIILSNALDNAIYACNSMDRDAEKYIRLTGSIQGDFILIEVENSFHGKGVVRKGTGLSNIKAVAKKYSGAVDIKVQDTIFVLSVLLIIPQHSESISRQSGLFAVSDRRKRQ